MAVIKFSAYEVEIQFITKERVSNMFNMIDAHQLQTTIKYLRSPAGGTDF